MPFLLGNQPAGTPWVIEIRNWEHHYVPDLRLWDINTGKVVVAPVTGSMADKIRAALDTPVKLDLQKAQLREALEYLRELTGVNIHYAAKVSEDESVKVRFSEPVPFGAVAQWFEDNYNVRFVVRDYGIVIVDPKTIPPGAMSLHDFWKSEKKKKAADTPKN
jgi:hypothetical protein